MSTIRCINVSAGESVSLASSEPTRRGTLSGPRLVVLIVVVVAAVVTIVRLWQEGSVPTSANPPLRTISLLVGEAPLIVEVALTHDELARGAMFRTGFAPGHGMLLVWPKIDRPCLWMRNASFPMSAAFINAEGAIVNVVDMQPHTDELHCPSKPIRYALEAPAGWFRDRGVRVNTQVKGLGASRLPVELPVRKSNGFT